MLVKLVIATCVAAINIKEQDGLLRRRFYPSRLSEAKSSEITLPTGEGAMAFFDTNEDGKVTRAEAKAGLLKGW